AVIGQQTLENPAKSTKRIFPEQPRLTGRRVKQHNHVARPQRRLANRRHQAQREIRFAGCRVVGRQSPVRRLGLCRTRGVRRGRNQGRDNGRGNAACREKPTALAHKRKLQPGCDWGSDPRSDKKGPNLPSLHRLIARKRASDTTYSICRYAVTLPKNGQLPPGDAPWSS